MLCSEHMLPRALTCRVKPHLTPHVTPPAGLTCVMVAAVIGGSTAEAAIAAGASAAAAAASAAMGHRGDGAAAGSGAAFNVATSPGDLVLLQGLLLQLWSPLQFLGWFYRLATCCFAVPFMPSDNF